MAGVDEFLATLSGPARDWMEHFAGYMRARHPECAELLYFGMPTYRPVPGDRRKYVAFSLARAHLSMHTLNFPYIEQLKLRLRRPGRGKGCVNVPFENADERAVLEGAIDELIAQMRAE